MVAQSDDLEKVPNTLCREFGKKLKPVLLPWLADCPGRPGLTLTNCCLLC